MYRKLIWKTEGSESIHNERKRNEEKKSLELYLRNARPSLKTFAVLAGGWIHFLFVYVCAQHLECGHALHNGASHCNNIFHLPSIRGFGTAAAAVAVHEIGDSSRGKKRMRVYSVYTLYYGCYSASSSVLQRTFEELNSRMTYVRRWLGFYDLLRRWKRRMVVSTKNCIDVWARYGAAAKYTISVMVIRLWGISILRRKHNCMVLEDVPNTGCVLP